MPAIIIHVLCTYYAYMLYPCVTPSLVRPISPNLHCSLPPPMRSLHIHVVTSRASLISRQPQTAISQLHLPTFSDPGVRCFEPPSFPFPYTLPIPRTYHHHPPPPLLLLSTLQLVNCPSPPPSSQHMRWAKFLPFLKSWSTQSSLGSILTWPICSLNNLVLHLAPFRIPATKWWFFQSPPWKLIDEGSARSPTSQHGWKSMLVLGSQFPEALPDLVSFELLIVKHSKRFRYPSWVFYDVEYRKWVAKHHIRNWSTTNPELYSIAFTGKALAKWKEATTHLIVHSSCSLPPAQLVSNQPQLPSAQPLCRSIRFSHSNHSCTPAKWNHPSADEHPSIISEGLATEVQKGWLIIPLNPASRLPICANQQPRVSS